MRDAESLLDQACSFCGDVIDYTDLKELFGIIDSELLFRLSNCIHTHDVQGVLGLVDLVFVEGYDVGEFLVNAADHFRNLLVARATENKDLLLVSDADADRYLGEAQHFSEKDLLRYINLIIETEVALKRATNPRLKFEFALLKMAKMESGVELGQLLDQLDALQGLPVTGPVSDDQKKTVKTTQAKTSRQSKPVSSPAGSRIAERRQQILSSAAEKDEPATNNASPINSAQKGTATTSETLTFADVQSIWPDVIEKIRKKRLTLGIFLGEGILHSLKNGILEIAFSAGNNFHSNTVMKNHAFVEETVNAISGGIVRLRCIRGDVVTEDQNPQLAASREGSSERTAELESQSAGVPDDKNLPGASPKTAAKKPTETQDIVKAFIAAVDGEIVG